MLEEYSLPCAEKRIEIWELSNLTHIYIHNSCKNSFVHKIVFSWDEYISIQIKLIIKKDLNFLSWVILLMGNLKKKCFLFYIVHTNVLFFIVIIKEEEINSPRSWCFESSRSTLVLVLSVCSNFQSYVVHLHWTHTFLVSLLILPSFYPAYHIAIRK